MAAALVPLAIEVAPSLIALIANLVHHHAPVAEQQYGTGTGPVKRADVLAAVYAALQKAAASGSIDKTLPPDAVITLIADAVLASMSVAGILDNPVIPAPAPTSSRVIVIAPGQTLTIQSAVLSPLTT